MPRGVYDRAAAAKKNGKTTDTAGTSNKKGFTMKSPVVAKVKATATASYKNVAVAVTNNDSLTRFHILRDNIIALSTVRRTLDVGDIAKRVDTEISAELDILTVLRRQSFGLTEAEQRNVKPANSGVSAIGIALPTPAPSILPPALG